MTIILNGDTGINNGAGSLDASAYTGSYTDGIVTDYTSGLGRISVGSSDGIAFYRGGIANTESMRIDSSGNLLVGGTVNNFGYRQEITGTSASSPFLGLSIFNTSVNQGAKIAFLDGGNSGAVGNIANNLVFYVSDRSTERMRITSDGSVSIGTASPATKLTVSSSVASNGAIGITVNDSTNSLNTQLLRTGSAYSYAGVGAYETWLYTQGASNLSLGPDGAGIVKIVNNGYERLRVDTSGNLLVGTTSVLASFSNTVQIAANASKQLFLRNTTSASGKCWGLGPDGSGNNITIYNQNGVGVYMIDGATAWSSSSDERVKDIIEPISDATNKISTLRAVIGKYKTDENGTRRSFLIAQDVQKILPEAVSVQDDELGTLGLSYTDTIPLLVAAIQELNAKVESLEAQLKGN